MANELPVEQVEEAPERIWTFLRPDGSRAWHTSRLEKSDTEYVRADIVNSLRAEVERLRTSQFSMEVIECDKCDLCEDHHG